MYGLSIKPFCKWFKAITIFGCSLNYRQRCKQWYNSAKIKRYSGRNAFRASAAGLPNRATQYPALLQSSGIETSKFLRLSILAIWNRD